MRGQERALGQEPGLEQVLVRVPVPELEQVPVPGLAQGLEQVQVMEQAAQAWVLDQGQARDKAALVPAALKGRMATDLVTEPAMVVLVLQTAQAMARAMARVRADLGRAPAANNSTPPSLL
jgi:hypothetical protein